ncbi:DUF5977 domain-containing protein [Arundinibacter roseus]|uniref:DUF5977 domain-containing protein n=1 Tax=Arundinibacter roseus TaxID=2070510 RepID=A0A4R4KM94_9BACT|nr:DUF5977 domain-containing protein [Arundinibacter roseus]TDB69113.1 hypothetical protein EZE20_01900 [Arundinibacter roseus]
MDYLANITHQKLVLTRNPVVVSVDPVVLPEGQSRIDLRYFCEVMVQKGFQGSSFELLSRHEASEQPPTAGSTTSAGAYFEIHTRLDDLLSTEPPEFGSNKVQVCANLTRQYYTRIERYDGDTLLDSEQQTSCWAIKAGVAERDYDTYHDLFFTRHIGDGRRFLTWQPDNKLVRVDQPEWLYFITNFDPTPSELRVRVRCLYDDNSRETYTAGTISNVSFMTVYALPVSMEALGLLNRPKTVIRYEVWLSNEAQEVVSETRSYQVWNEHFETVKYLLYQNGLGGYDTLAFVGNLVESVKVSRSLVSRFVGYDYLPTVAEDLINEVTGERQLSLTLGGRISERQRSYLQDLLFSQEFYLADGEWIPLMPLFDGYVTENVDEWPIDRTLTFRYANAQSRYSSLPRIAKESRPTSWREWTTSCEIGANGLRTGRRIVNELVKYYLDSGENVRPLITKANTPNTEGYISPWLTEDCAATTTPYLSTSVEISSTLKRTGCGPGTIGSVWTITLPAGAYGSELSQADADAKALAAAQALDTQAAANSNGSCVPTTPIPLALQNTTTDVPGVFDPVIALLVNDVEVVPNTDVESSVRYADNGLAAGTYNIDVRISYGGSPFQEFRLSIPSKNLTSAILSGNQTYRFANVVVNWGDAELLVKALPL